MYKMQSFHCCHEVLLTLITKFSADRKQVLQRESSFILTTSQLPSLACRTSSGTKIAGHIFFKSQ